MDLVDDSGLPKAEMENLIGALSGVYQVIETRIPS